MWQGVPFAWQRRPIIGVLRMCWLLPGSFDCPPPPPCAHRSTQTAKQSSDSRAHCSALAGDTSGYDTRRPGPRGPRPYSLGGTRRSPLASWALAARERVGTRRRAPPCHIRSVLGGCIHTNSIRGGAATHPHARHTPSPEDPLCDIPSGCCSFTGPWTVTRSSLRMLRRVATFCRPLRPVLLLVSFPRSRSPVVGVLGLC